MKPQFLSAGHCIVHACNCRTSALWGGFLIQCMHTSHVQRRPFLGSVTKHHDVGSAIASQQALIKTRALLMRLRASPTPTAHYKSSRVCTQAWPHPFCTFSDYAHGHEQAADRRQITLLSSPRQPGRHRTPPFSNLASGLITNLMRTRQVRPTLGSKQAPQRALLPASVPT